MKDELPDWEKGEQPCFTVAEIAQIIERSPQSYKTVWSLVAETGIRRGEICGLNVGDVDVDQRIIVVQRSRTKRGKLKAPKAGIRNGHVKPRVFSFSPSLAEQLRPFVESRHAEEASYSRGQAQAHFTATRCPTYREQKPYRNFFPRATSKPAKINPTTGSTARNGDSVQRRRFQRGSVRLNKAKTMWTGEYVEYALDPQGAEKRIRRKVVLSPARKDGIVIGKREAQRLLQPYVDRANMALSQPIRERKSATFEEFAEIWERDYLSLSKPSTQSGTRSTLKRLKTAFRMKQFVAYSIVRTAAASESHNRLGF